ncbi:MAG TPA: SGNH/GDSL hydrolase family protein [Nocardioides sp.]|uniref:SGNH/GDSL hydrolase family protein n=1 Tax=Nocardioides sp. TaxID=35761 RepID=UPI002C4C4FC8|nr:SGNH/GDSL hydrolase family protein [Nocardioides sp.]HQR28227.1 SGNH/GDSL hydrolase family protein [Nocardioides sp.]
MRIPTWAAAALAALVALVVAVAVVRAQPSADRAQALPAAAQDARIDYVALGDSYSAGPLVPAGRPDPRGCFRSTNNYPAFLAGYLQVRSYRDVTCSGATTEDLFAPQGLLLGGERPPAQLSALSRGTDLVTVGIGGNDFGLFGSLIATCGRLAAAEPAGAPCREHFTDAQGVDTLARDARLIQANVARVLREVRARAPEARVYVVGYPRILPADGTVCAQAPLAAGDYRWADSVERLLNRSLRRAALASGARYVDLYAASAGHDVCAGPAAWVNGNQLLLGVAADYHPFLRGMRGIARAIYHQVTGERAPAGQYAAPPPGSVVTNPAP